MRPLPGTLLLASLATLPAALAAQAEPKGLPTAVIVRGPDVGQRAPDLALQWATRDTIGPVGQPFRLVDNLGKVVVLAFYPRDFTRGCTAQFRTFAAQRDSLFGPDVVVVGISADSLSTHQRFARSLDLPFMLLSDPDQKVSQRYGSAASGGLNRRTVYVIRPDGRVSYRNMEFVAVDPKAYRALGSAVAEARR
jgi:peroxiredoxin Q/BCP